MHNYSAILNENIENLKNNKGFSAQKEALSKVFMAMKNSGAKYALAGPVSMFYMGIVNNFRSIDILIDIKDSQKVDKTIRSNSGVERVKSNCSAFPDDYEPYMVYNILGIEVHVISWIRVMTPGCNFLFNFGDEDTKKYVQYKEETYRASLLDPEMSYILALLTEGQPDGQNLRVAVEEYLIEEGLDNPQIFKNLLDGKYGLVSSRVKAKVKFLLK